MKVDAITDQVMADPRQRKAMLKQVVNEFVGTTFFEPMLKAAHNSKLKGKYGHGGRGEDIFQGQLDAELARSMGQGIKTNLGEAIYRKLTGQAGSTPS